MKKRILVIVLCLACVASYGQKRKKKSTKKRAATTQTVAASTTTSTEPAVDTTKKQVAAVPAKPFDRPMDGYYKKTNIFSAKVTPYPYLRESDVAYAKRVWR
jgi:hypothetical protein